MYYQNLIIIHECTCSKKLLKMKNSKSFLTPTIHVINIWLHLYLYWLGWNIVSLFMGENDFKDKDLSTYTCMDKWYSLCSSPAVEVYVHEQLWGLSMTSGDLAVEVMTLMSQLEVLCDGASADREVSLAFYSLTTNTHQLKDSDNCKGSRSHLQISFILKHHKIMQG